MPAGSEGVWCLVIAVHFHRKTNKNLYFQLPWTASSRQAPLLYPQLMLCLAPRDKPTRTHNHSSVPANRISFLLPCPLLVSSGLGQEAADAASTRACVICALLKVVAVCSFATREPQTGMHAASTSPSTVAVAVRHLPAWEHKTRGMEGQWVHVFCRLSPWWSLAPRASLSITCTLFARTTLGLMHRLANRSSWSLLKEQRCSVETTSMGAMLASGSSRYGRAAWCVCVVMLSLCSALRRSPSATSLGAPRRISNLHHTRRTKNLLPLCHYSQVTPHFTCSTCHHSTTPLT